MNKKVSKFIKIVIVVVISLLFIWFLILSPWITFKGYEKKMIEAAEKYIELNTNEAPTGKRIKTIKLQDLYYKAYLKEDFYVPYTTKACSLVDSWVKIAREDDEYKYYTYLKCGVLESEIDHKGPVITLEGKDKITVTKGDKFNDPGVKSVVDNKDGIMDIKEVSVKGKVDSSKIGTYEITYTAYDKLNNKSQVKREVEVVERLKSTIMDKTNKKGYYTGLDPDNYIRLSGMLFRIVKVEGSNVVIVSDEDIANVDYNGINDWLDDYFYDHLADGAKKLIVDNKYCNMSTNDKDIATISKCSKYTSNRKVYIPSAIDINRAEDESGNFMKPTTLSWTSQSYDSNNAFAVRKYVLGTMGDITYVSMPKNENYGVRPMLTIKGDILLKGGNGSADNPYTFGEIKNAEVDDLLNTRYSGEYIDLSGMLWRIIEVNSDGTTKIISMDTLRDKEESIETSYQIDSDVRIYNPKENGNVGYFINNKASKYVDTKYFVNKNVEVPIYKDKIKYGKEETIKKYKVKLAAPSLYEMFSAFSSDSLLMNSYWFRDSSKNEDVVAVQSQIGTPMTSEIGFFTKYGIRLVGNLNNNIAIVSGKGTYNEPYKISK